MAEAWVRRILVVEDEAFIRGLVQEILVRGGFEVRAAASAREALEAADGFDPDAAILDIDLGSGPTGLDICDALRVQFPHMAVVFLTQIPSPEVMGRAESSAAAAYLIKRDLADPHVLVDALEHVLRDGDPREKFRDDLERHDPLARLSDAQVETLRLIAEGLSNDEIARRRGVTPRAVEAMASRIFAALDVGADPRISPRVAAARIYMEYAGRPPLTEAER